MGCHGRLGHAGGFGCVVLYTSARDLYSDDGTRPGGYIRAGPSSIDHADDAGGSMALSHSTNTAIGPLVLCSDGDGFGRSVLYRRARELYSGDGTRPGGGIRDRSSLIDQVDDAKGSRAALNVM